jgi:hypothetical protein
MWRKCSRSCNLSPTKDEDDVWGKEKAVLVNFERAEGLASKVRRLC